MGSRQHRSGALEHALGVRIEGDVLGTTGSVGSLTACHFTLTLIGRRQRDLLITGDARPAGQQRTWTDDQPAKDDSATSMT
jgi:hypothetical protein